MNKRDIVRTREAQALRHRVYGDGDFYHKGLHESLTLRHFMEKTGCNVIAVTNVRQDWEPPSNMHLNSKMPLMVAYHRADLFFEMESLDGWIATTSNTFQVVHMNRDLSNVTFDKWVDKQSLENQQGEWNKKQDEKLRQEICEELGVSRAYVENTERADLQAAQKSLVGWKEELYPAYLAVQMMGMLELHRMEDDGTLHHLGFAAISVEDAVDRNRHRMEDDGSGSFMDEDARAFQTRTRARTQNKHRSLKRQQQQNGIFNDMLLSNGYKQGERTRHGDSPTYFTSHLLYNFFSSRYVDVIKPKQHSIEVRSSIMSRVEGTKLSLKKNRLLSSPYLAQGTKFSFREDTLEKEAVTMSVWLENDRLWLAHRIDKKLPEGRVGVSFAYFDVGDLPDKITSKNIEKMFQKDRKKIDRLLKKNPNMSFDELLMQHFNVASFENSLEAEIEIFFKGETMGINKNCFNEVQTDDYSHQHLTLALKLICALNSPELRGKIRIEVSKKRIGFKAAQKTGLPRGVHEIRKLAWGEDRVYYVYPKATGKANRGMRDTYVMPHPCKYYIKKLENYADFDIFEEEDGRYSVDLMRDGHWPGELPPNITYTLGKGEQPRGYSEIAIRWLDGIARKEGVFIQHAENQGEHLVPVCDGKYFKLDGFCKETNTVYEFHGDIWHGNPDVFDPEDTPHPHSDLTAAELFEATIQRENLLKQWGFNLVTMWENDYKGRR